MRSKTDFYRLFFEQLARRGFDVKRSQSSDYIADIYFKNQLVAYFSKADTGLCFPTMGTVIGGGTRVFQRSQRIWMPISL